MATCMKMATPQVISIATPLKEPILGASVTTKGLTNHPGQNNCFLNSSVQNKLGHARFQNKLNSIRGLVAKTMIGAYVTTSTEAASVLANVPLMEQLIMEALDVERFSAG
ncbi:unnamed protein product [Ceutorhynchus assimilis]|uniref:Uncharacterized protein n=1 Tax=Ceutorhynchus assimilis TaxID=467358 RepID=A0A9N9MHR7_9CUCU|nr:unnamed protein product [Ceutorhynchus assimilis]